jgi:hypothetical protein
MTKCHNATLRHFAHSQKVFAKIKRRKFSLTMSRGWFKNWEANAPAPATTVRPKATPSSSTAAAAADNTRRISFSGLCASVHPTDKGLRVKVILEESIAIPFGDDSDIELAAGAELEVSRFQTHAPPPTFGNLDRIRVVGCFAKSSSTTPGARYINCQEFELIQSCWDLDNLYLARQSLEGKFIVTSRTVKCDVDKANPQDGLFSQMVWPKDVSLISKDQREFLYLHFRLQYAPWTADEVLADDEPPAAMTFCFKMWEKHCVQLMPGPVPMDTWKEIMAHGINPIPFVALVSIKQEATTPTGWSNGGDQELDIHVLRADFVSYVTSRACPLVSRDLVEAHTQVANKKKPTRAKTGAGAIVNVSATGLTKDVGGAFPTFRAMTSAPDELTDEEAIREALEAGTVSAVQFFAVPDDARGTKEAPNKKQKK